MKKTSRRAFIKTASGISSGILAAPFLLESCAPSNQITIGMIGNGSHCMGWNFPPFLAMEDVRVLAVCDVDRNRMVEAKKVVDENYQNKDGSITIPEVLRPYMGGKEKIGE